MSQRTQYRKRKVQLKIWVTADEKHRMAIGAAVDQRSLGGFVRHLTLKRADALIAKLRREQKHAKTTS